MSPSLPQHVPLRGVLANLRDPSSEQTARAADPAFIVRHRPREGIKQVQLGAGMETTAFHGRETGVFDYEQNFFPTRDLAETFALQLVHSGDAVPCDVSLYENMNLFVDVQLRSLSPNSPAVAVESTRR